MVLKDRGRFGVKILMAEVRWGGLKRFVKVPWITMYNRLISQFILKIMQIQESHNMTVHGHNMTVYGHTQFWPHLVQDHVINFFVS